LFETTISVIWEYAQNYATVTAHSVFAGYG